MKLLVVAGLVGLALVVAGGARPDALWGLYQQLYPADPAQRQALDECFAQDPQFNRLDADAREACYRHSAPGASSADTGTLGNYSQHPAGNFVDLWRAAGQGHMQQNDVRAQEENARYIQPQTFAQRQ